MRQQQQHEEDSYATTTELAAFHGSLQFENVSGVGNDCLARTVGQQLGVFEAGAVDGPAQARVELANFLEVNANDGTVSAPVAAWLLPGWLPAALAGLLPWLAWLLECHLTAA